MAYRSNHKVFKSGWSEEYGQDLGDFLNDPAWDIDDAPRHVEAIQNRCYGTLGRLIALLVDKGVITPKEAAEVSDIEYDLERTFKVKLDQK